MSGSNQLILCSDKACPLAKNFAKETLAATRCPAVDKLTQALTRFFGFDSFQPGQLEALLPVAHGKDVFVQMPTGGGKSLCMFVFPFALDNHSIGLIVSPLVGPMDQQVCTIYTM